jgi:phage repressor protein C with HTH and peptisase S24 domain
MSTTMVDDAFRQRLRLIMQQFGSVADLARAVGVSDNAIYKWVSGRGQPSMISLVNLGKAAGVSVEWLATGRGIPAKSKPDPDIALERSQSVLMPRHGVRAASDRSSIQSSQVVDYVNFRSEWLQRTLGIDHKNLALIEVIGDSMSPTIDEGDLVLADVRETCFKNDGVYILRNSHDLSVKRIQRQPDQSLMVRSDNSAYAPFVVSPDKIILAGRVVWVGGRL